QGTALTSAGRPRLSKGAVRRREATIGCAGLAGDLRRRIPPQKPLEGAPLHTRRLRQVLDRHNLDLQTLDPWIRRGRRILRRRARAWDRLTAELDKRGRLTGDGGRAILSPRRPA